MAEIKDVYSLEFNGSQFQTEINSAIQSIDELNNAMAQGVDVADDLEAAQGNLVNVLNTEAKGVEQLNQKRNVLVNTQKKINSQTNEGIKINNELDKTNKKISDSTADVTNKQKSFGGQLLQGARNINGLRRAGMMLGNVFRLLGGINPFGLLLTVLPTVISYIFGATSAQKAFNEATESAVQGYAKEKVALDELFVSLNDANIKGEERSAIIQQVNDQYGDYLPNLLTEASTAEEIAAAYDLINNALIRKAVTQAKTNALEAVTGKLLQDRIAGLERQRKAQKDLDDAGVGILMRNKDGEEMFSRPTNDDQARAISNFKAAKKNLQNIDKAYKEEVKKINESAEDLEKSLGLIQVPTTPKPPKPPKTPKEFNEKIRKEREDFNKMLLREELEQKQNQRQEYLLEEKVFLDDLNKEYENYLEEKRLADEKALEERRAAEEKYQNEISLERFQKEIEDLETNLQAGLKYREDNRNTQLAQDLLFLEEQRNLELNAAAGNAEAQAKIDEKYNKKRKDIESKANIDILNLRIEFLEKIKEASKDFIDPATLASLNRQIADLKLQLEEAGKSIGDGLEPPDPKKLIEQIGQVVTGISDSVFSVLNAQVQAYIEGLDKAIDKSKSALDEIRNNSEDFNARQLEIEKERLEKLEAERARAVEREKTLAQVQIAINASIAISKALIEGGGFASAVTVGLTIASLIAGLAQARAAAGNAFFKGVEYLERGNNKAGRDTIPAMLNEGERVITTDTNNKYWDVLSAVHNNRIPADVLNTFSKAYQQGGIKNALGAFGDNVSLSNELGQKSIFVNVAQTYGGLENRLERIENVLTELPKYMPKTTVSANANGIFKIVEQRQARKNFSRNWSK